MLKKHIEESLVLGQEILKDQTFLASFEAASTALSDCFKHGGKLLVAGNGGSAAQAQHLSAEFVGKYDKLERKAHPALALTVDTSILTAWSNDYHFHSVFARQIEAHGKNGDIFLGISTSGNSQNIIEALKTAKSAGMKTVALLGKGGGKTKGLADIELIVPSGSTARVQEIHNILIHALTDEVEQRLHNPARR